MEYIQVKIKQHRKKNRKNFWGILLALPGIITLILVLAYPLIKAFILSFQKYDLLKDQVPTFNKLNNFIKFFEDPNFLLYTKNTFIWIFFTVAGLFVVGITLALILSKDIKFRGLFRGLALIPWVTPPVVAGLVWRWMLDGQWGILNYLLLKFHLIKEPIVWLYQMPYVWICVIIVAIWKFFPFWYINLLAGLQMISKELYDASSIDGATSLQVFFYITLPMLQPVLFVLFILQIIWSANEFTMIWVMTQGGPGNITMTIAPLVYVTSFRYYRMGYGAAIGVMLMFTMIIISIIYINKVKQDVA